MNPIHSTFSDIFDVLHFINSLQGDLRIVMELPKELEPAPRARKHFTSWSGVGYYEEMTQLFKEYQVCLIFCGCISKLKQPDLGFEPRALFCVRGFCN